MNSNDTVRLAPSSALWASAFVILAMIFVVAGRGGGNTARAEMVSSAGDFTVMTTQGQNEQILYVLDERSEQLLVYKVVRKNEVQLFQSLNLTQTFEDAKRWAGRR